MYVSRIFRALTSFNLLSFSKGFDMIGGDGTAIGIPIDSLRSLKQVWVPPDAVRTAPWACGRIDRCIIVNDKDISKSDFAKSRKIWSTYLNCDIKREDRESVTSHFNILPECAASEVRFILQQNKKSSSSQHTIYYHHPDEIVARS
jgi:hypothetical protein